MNTLLNNKPVNILMVEDDPTDLMLTKEALTHAKVLSNLYVVENGVEAMAFLHRQGEYAKAPRPDIILLDLNMPRKNGQEVLAEVKADDDLKHIAIVIVAASSKAEDVLKTYGLPADCYISKSGGFKAFDNVVRAVQGFWLTTVTLPA